MATEAVETIRLATGDARLQDAVGVRFSSVGVLDVVELAPGEPGALARDVHVVAVAPGTAVIEVVGDGGEVLDWTVMSVAVPDAIELRFDEGGRERATGAAGGEIELAVGARKSIFAAVLDDAGQMLMTGNTIDGSIMTWTIDDAGAVDVFTIGPVAIVDTVAAGDGLVAAETPNGLRVALDVRVW